MGLMTRHGTRRHQGLYCIIATNEHCLKLLRDFLNDKVGKRRVENEGCGVYRITWEEKVLVTIVHAPEWYRDILGAIRGGLMTTRALGYDRRETVRVVSLKIPDSMVAELDRAAKEMGLSRSELIRKIIAEWLAKRNSTR